MNEIKQIDDALFALKSRYEKKYGFALFDVVASPSKNGVVLKGRVLVKDQKKQALKCARDVFSGAVKAEIKILGELGLKPEKGWAVAKEVADVWRFLPGSKPAEGLKSEDANRSSQLDAWDYAAKIIDAENRHYLIIMVDGTIGWVDKNLVNLIPFDGANYWRNASRGISGSKTGVPGSFEDLSDAAFSYLGTPYLWGGTTKAGIDCSGFVQRVYYEGLGIVLPKHSKDQLKVGERIKKEEIGRGDIVFFTIDKSILHVGIALSDGQLVHASRDEKKVVLEPLPIALEKRRFAGARRVVAFEQDAFGLPSDEGEEIYSFLKWEEESF